MEDYVIVYEPKPIEKPEYRLYYDELGKVLFYTCEKPEGTFIVIDSVTYAEGRHDIRVVDNKIVRTSPNIVLSKLIPSITGIGVNCAKEDISVIVDKDYRGEITTWELKTREFN